LKNIKFLLYPVNKLFLPPSIYSFLELMQYQTLAALSIENMKMMLTTYLIRNRWNVQIIEQE